MSNTPNPTPPDASQVSGSNFLADAPFGDLSFSELFPPEGATTPAAGQTPTPPVQPAVTPPEETFFIKTGTGTVYKDRDSAIKGIEEKDRVIEQLRQRSALEHGVDPITNQPVHLPSGPGSPQAPSNYLQSRGQYLKDLASAVTSQDGDAYFNAQAKFVTDLLAPVIPVITSFAKQQAVAQVGTEFKDFGDFLTSDAYKQTLMDVPDLKQAIETAEGDPILAARLPGYYRLAYLASQGRRLPELLKEASKPPSPQPGRPTIGASTMTPPQTVSIGTDLNEALGSSAGRKAIIEQFEGSGAAKLVW